MRVADELIGRLERERLPAVVHAHAPVLAQERAGVDRAQGNAVAVRFKGQAVARF
jgi:hypothetical protein